MSTRILGVILVILGLVGALGCSAAGLAVWSLVARIERGADRAFETVDDSFSAIQERIRQTQSRVEGLKISAAEIGDTMRAWTEDMTVELAETRSVVTEKVESLSSGLQVMDQWFDVTESSIQVLQVILEVGSTLGVTISKQPLDRVERSLEELRTQLEQATSPVRQISERLSENDGGISRNTRNTRRQQILQLTVRVVANLTSVESQIQKVGDGFTELEGKIYRAKNRAEWRLRLAAICITALILWMAAGQLALCCIGWKRWTVVA